MRIAITGTGGRVGAALAAHLGAKHEVIALTREDLDLSQSGSLEPVLDRLECEVFLNPAAVTSLEACEDDPQGAMRVNSAAAGKIAIWAAKRGVRMIHFSTDYVFSGDTQTPYNEAEPARPINVYGRSKLAGEQAVLAHPRHLVFRVSWVFGPEKPSFIDQVIADAMIGKPLAAVADKFSLPTSTTDLVQWTELLLGRQDTGLMHACQSGPAVSWHGMAEWVLQEMERLGMVDERPFITAQELDQCHFFRARRPRFTAMDNARLAASLGYQPRDWREAITDYVLSRHDESGCGKA